MTIEEERQRLMADREREFVQTAVGGPPTLFRCTCRQFTWICGEADRKRAERFLDVHRACRNIVMERFIRGPLFVEDEISGPEDEGE